MTQSRRASGWSAKPRKAFLGALASAATPSEAAALAKTTVESALQLRSNCAEFARGWANWLSAERLPVAPRGSTTTTASADAGRALASDDQPNGATLLHVLDLPTLPGSLPTTPRLWLAAAGLGSAWRRASVEVSFDDGESYQNVTTALAASVMGSAVAPLGVGPHDRWDNRNSIEVELANESMWLDSRSETAILGGANLAVLGNEIFQFANVTLLGAGRFRLSGLLRGRRGSEFAVGNHVAGERFVLLDPDALVPFDPPIDAIGRSLRFRAGAYGADQATVELLVAGNALRPISPVGLVVAPGKSGSALVSWVRRSRGGFAWIDGIDAPLAEERESYAITVLRDGVPIRNAVSDTPRWAYQAVDRIADGTGGALRVQIEVAQTSSVVGPGESARATVDFLAV